MTVLAVMLGVAFVSGTLVSTDTLNHAYRGQAAKSYAHMDVEVSAQADDSGRIPGISRKTFDEIARLDGVAEAAGRVEGIAFVADKNGGFIGEALYIEASNFAQGKDGKDGRYEFTDGSGPTEADQVALDWASAESGGYRVGDTVPVAIEGPAKTYKLSGIFTSEATSVAGGGSLVLFDTPLAQRLFLRPGAYHSVTVTAAPGTSSTELSAAVKKLLPDHVNARTRQQLADIVKADYRVSDDGAGLDASALAALRQAEGVRAVSPEQTASMTVDGSWQQVSGVAPADFPEVIHLTVVSGSLDTLTKGQIAVADDVARSNGWKVGDTLPVKYDDSKTGRLTVGAVFESNEVVSPVVVSSDGIEPHEEAASISWIYVKTDSDTDEKALADALARYPGSKVEDRQGIREFFNGEVGTTLNVMYALLAMSLVIAVLGVVNTLAMSVFERQREVGMLRAVGLDRQGVTRMIQLESSPSSAP